MNQFLFPKIWKTVAIAYARTYVNIQIQTNCIYK